MSGFHTFAENELYMMLHSWRKSGVRSLNITCGPLIVFGSYDLGEEIWRIHGIRRGRIMAGSISFYSPRYSLFRCLYGIMRTRGLENQEWEMSDPHSFRYHVEYLNLIYNFIPYMRVKMQRGPADEAICIQNLLGHAYMKITPVHQNYSRNNEWNLYIRRALNDDNDADSSLALPTASVLGMQLGFVNDDVDDS